MTGERSLSEVMQDILRDVQEIFRAEVRLAKAEIKDETTKALSSTAWIGAGAAAGLFAAVFALWTAVFALNLVMPIWAAALVVTAVLAAVAGVVLATGIRRFRQVHPIPDRTVETIKENVAWVRQSVK